MTHQKITLVLNTLLALNSMIQATPKQKADLEAKHQGSSSIHASSTIAEDQFTKSAKENMIVRDVNVKHILMYHPWGTKSHKGQQHALLLGLLDRGHMVSGVFHEGSNIIHDGYTEIIVETR